MADPVSGRGATAARLTRQLPGASVLSFGDGGFFGDDPCQERFIFFVNAKTAAGATGAEVLINMLDSRSKAVMSQLPIDFVLYDFAIRGFRNIADGDYISARMACRAQLAGQFLWASQQAIEKYIKCILLLNRIPGKDVRHDLNKGLAIINASGKMPLTLTAGTKEFIDYLDKFGRFRYLEVPNAVIGLEIISLDRAVWELRRFCAIAPDSQVVLCNGQPAPKVRLPDGQLEKIIDNASDPAREPLLWQNAFFGKRTRRHVKLKPWFKASNAPLSFNPNALDEVLKYVFLPKDVIAAYTQKRMKASTP